MAQLSRLGLIFSFAYFLILLPFIAVVPVGSSSEAREIHVAKIMFQSGEYILPLRGGLIPSKPPLFHWLAASIGHISGEVNEFTSRAVSLLFASLTIFIAVRIAVRFTAVADRKKTALLATLILGTTYEFMRLATDARVDMVFCFFVTLAVSFIALPLTPYEQKYNLNSSAYKKSDFMYFYLASVAAVLAKGPLGIILAVVCGFSITTAHYGLKQSLLIWLNNRAGLYLFILLAPIWYYLAYEKAGFDFIARQLFFENIERFTGEVNINTEPFWYYVPNFLRFAFPWSVLFIVFFIQDLIKGISRNRKLNAGLSGLNLMYVWFFAGFIFFSVADGKRHAYILPLFVPFSVLLALKLSTSGFLTFKYREKLKNLFVFLTLAAGIALLLLPESIKSDRLLLLNALEWIRSCRFILLPALLLPSVFCLLSAYFKSDKYWSRDSLLMYSFQLFVFGGILIGYGIKNNYKSFKQSAAAINSLAGGKHDIYVIRSIKEELTDPLLMYLNREVLYQKPEDVKLNCGAYYIYENKYAGNFPELMPLQVFSQLPDKLKDIDKRNIILSRYDCS